MDATWKRTYDALTQLRREIKEGSRDAGAQHLDAEKKLDLCRAIDAVRNDTSSTLRLGRLLEKHFA